MDKNINIAFSFDNNYWRQGAVAICSLFNNSSQEAYNIFCLCTEDVTDIAKQTIQKLVNEKSKKSFVFFIDIGKALDNAYECRGISKASYGRLLLHKLLPNIDKIIYSDVDVLFLDSLKEAWDVDVENFFFAAVKSVRNNLEENFSKNLNLPFWNEYLKDAKGSYINSGFMTMNLKKIREKEMDKIWLSWTDKKLFFQDQDILNITCKNEFTFLKSSFNIIDLPESYTYRKALKENIISKEEYTEIEKKPIILHYTGRKPWNSLFVNYSFKWWLFVITKTPFFLHFLKKYLSTKLLDDLYFGQKQIIKKIIELHWTKTKKIIKIFGLELYYKI